jgi:hypothetical protein
MATGSPLPAVITNFIEEDFEESELNQVEDTLSSEPTDLKG